MGENKETTTPAREKLDIAVLLLTCGRAELTAQTWHHNLRRAGYPHRLFWYDNGSEEADYLRMVDESWEYNITWHESLSENIGIALALNWMIVAAFARGADAVVTMANDILEPDNWLKRRVEAMQAIPNTGAVAIGGDFCHRYALQEENGVTIEEGGDIIGNYLITRAAYEKVGLFCTDYGIYGPLDLDYCFRMKCAGLRYYYAEGEAQHIGTVDRNPEEYTEIKKNSLAASWKIFSLNQQMYRKGEKIYQNAT